MANDWKAFGPAPELTETMRVSGRVNAIAVSSDINGGGVSAMFLGTHGGGVWRSADFAAKTPTWVPLTDALRLGVPARQKSELLVVTALAVDPQHPRVIYAGTRAGLLKSTNGGESWMPLGELGAPHFSTTKILIDLTDPSGNTLYIAGGITAFAKWIFKSGDGGQTWISKSAGLPDGVYVDDIEFTVIAGKLTLYAGMNHAGAKNGIALSTDGGTSWSKMGLPLVALDKSTPATDAIGQITLAADHAPGAAFGVYAAITDRFSGNLLNVFALDNNDATWKPARRGLPTPLGTRNGFAQSLGLSPDGGLYLGLNGYDVFLSNKIDQDWFAISKDEDLVKPHVDHHAWGFADGAVYDGNDGGIWRFTPRPNQAPGPGTWEGLNTPGLQTILANGVSLCPTSPDVLLVGSLDNGLARRTGGVWNAITSGDGGYVWFDPDPKSKSAYFAPYHEPGDPFLYRSDDFGYHFPSPISPVVDVHEDIGLPAPIAFDPANTSRLLTGRRKVYESPFKGSQWNEISPALDGAAFVSALAYAGQDIYTGYDSGKLFKRAGGALDWHEVQHGVDWGGVITDIGVDPRHGNMVYVAASDVNGKTAKAWRSLDAGATWTEITGNLGALGVLALRVYPIFGVADPWLFAATRVGVWVATTLHGPTTCWRRFGNGLPDVLVSDLDLKADFGLLAAATLGRGVFVTSIGPLSSPKAAIHAPVYTCPGTGPIEHQEVMFRAEVEGFSDGTVLTYTWQAIGAVPEIFNTKPTFSMIMPAAGKPATVTLTVDAEGCVLSAARTLTAMTLNDLLWAEMRCQLQHIAHVNPHANPLSDPPRDLAARPLSERDIHAIYQMAQRLVDLSQRLLDVHRTGFRRS